MVLKLHCIALWVVSTVRLVEVLLVRYIYHNLDYQNFNSLVLLKVMDLFSGKESSKDLASIMQQDWKLEDY